MPKPQLAAQLYTIREFTQTAEGFAESMAKVRAIGYTAVQVSAIGPIPHEQVKAIVDEVGLTICITHIGQDRLWNEPDDVIAQHQLWDCKHVAIGSMPRPYRADQAGFLRFAKEASAVGKQLHEAGLTFSYHNHSFEFVRFGKRTGLDLLYEESDPRYLQAELDTYWMKGRMPVVHLKDMVIVEDEPTMAEIGEGNLNWPAILAACAEAGVEWYAIEQDICRRNPFESLKISYDNLRQMGLE
jgi:sugar phosphate isomerase/epimerase